MPPRSLAAAPSWSSATEYVNVRARIGIGRTVHGGVVRAPAYGATVQRLRRLSEAECYARCYGWRGGEDSVRVVKVTPRTPRFETTVSGELLRVLFEDKIDSRTPEAA